MEKDNYPGEITVESSELDKLSREDLEQLQKASDLKLKRMMLKMWTQAFLMRN